jgi:hypothetical protein
MHPASVRFAAAPIRYTNRSTHPPQHISTPDGARWVPLPILSNQARSSTHSPPDYETEPISPISNRKKGLRPAFRLGPSPLVSCPRRPAITRSSARGAESPESHPVPMTGTRGGRPERPAARPVGRWPPPYETEPILPISNAEKGLRRPFRLGPSPIISCPRRPANTRSSMPAPNRPDSSRSRDTKVSRSRVPKSRGAPGRDRPSVGGSRGVLRMPRVRHSPRDGSRRPKTRGRRSDPVGPRDRRKHESSSADLRG